MLLINQIVQPQNRVNDLDVINCYDHEIYLWNHYLHYSVNNGVIHFSWRSQVSLSVTLDIPAKKRKRLTEAELELRRVKREEAAAKRARIQEETKKKQQLQKYKKK